MRLEGTLDAFSLPDIFQLLSYTQKTGALHLRRADGPDAPVQHGAVHVRGGLVTGARSDVTRLELGRRLVGSGLIDDDALASAAERLADDPSAGLVRLLVDNAQLDADTARRIAAEQATDAVFDLMRWPDGEFAFVVDELDPDDLGAQLPTDAVVAEGRRRIEAWSAVAASVPAPDAVLRLAALPPADLAVTADEWSLLSLVDGRRTVADLVALAGRGQYVVVTALAGLVARGLLVAGEAGEDRLLRRHRLLAALEGRPLPEDEVVAPAVAARGDDGPVIPSRPEPFGVVRQVEHAEDVSGLVGSGASVHAMVNGATALAPDAVPAQPGVVERDPSINKTLLLRLIAGVRGL